MAIERTEEWSKLLRVIAHPTRLMILMELTHGTKCVNDIQDLVEIPQANVSQHLAILKEGGLVISHKDSVSRCYHLAKPGLMKDLLAVLGADYPTAQVDDPGPCRAARKARRSRRPTRQKRAASSK